MSMVKCVCGAIIDSDEELDCFLGDEIYCESCMEDLADEPCEFVMDTPATNPDCKCTPCRAREALA